jgi:hypothetical protein
MPCPLLGSDNYPDYIKKILQEINAGNDDELKTCACLLKTVLDDQHECAEPMTDGKLALFPFCIIDTETDPTTISVAGNPYSYWPFPIGISLDDLMLLYWQNYNISINGIDFITCPTPDPDGDGPEGKGSYSIAPGACGDIDKTYTGSYGIKAATKENIKYLVCSSILSAHMQRTCLFNEEQYGCVPCVTNGWGGIIAFTKWTDHPVCYRYNKKYYPDLSFVSASLSTTQQDGGSKGEAKLKIKDNSYSLTMYEPLSCDEDCCSINLINSSISI